MLWAKLLEQLWSNVEEECGAFSVRRYRAIVSLSLSGEKVNDDDETKRRKREMAVAKLVIKGTASLVLSVLAATLLLTLFDIRSYLATKILAPIISSVPALYVLIQTAMKIVPELLQSRGATILNEVQSFGSHDRPDFSQMTGFMGYVHREVEYLFDFLKTEYFDDDELKVRRRICLSLFVNDLDRCQKETVMSVLEAVTLLLSDQPITVWLAIDSRIVVASIEDNFEKILTKAGIDGYHYLEKMIQIPFCIPDLDDTRKVNFLQGILAGEELDPLRAFRRLVYLKNENVDQLNDLLEDYSTEPASKRDNYMLMVSVLEKLIDRNAYNDGGQTSAMTSSPEKVLNRLKTEGIFETNSGCEQIRLQDQLLYWVSNGIEQILTKRNAEVFDVETDVEVPPAQARIIPERLDDALDRPNGSLRSRRYKFRDSYEYGTVFQPYANPTEVAWFDSYAKYFTGKPRKMKRIVNSYMLARFVANMKRSDTKSTGDFYMNLMKSTVLLEQWPYRMAWMLLVVENLQQKIENMDIRRVVEVQRESPSGSGSIIGESLISVFEKIMDKQNISFEDCQHLPLFEVYYRVVEALIHSSHDSSVQLQRDGDPQMFEQILLNDEDSNLKLKHLALLGSGDQDSSADTFRPYAFNLQRHMVEKVSVDMETFRFTASIDGKITHIISKKDVLFTSRSES